VTVDEGSVEITHNVFAGTKLVSDSLLLGYLVRVDNGELNMRSNCFVGNDERIAPAIVDQAQVFASASFVQRRSDDVAPTGCEFISKVTAGSLQESEFDHTEFDCVSSTTTDFCTAIISDTMSQEMPCEESLAAITTNESRIQNTSLVRTYVLCPEKQYMVGSSPIVIGQPNMHVICGVDGDVNNDCVLWGGLVQLKLSDMYQTTGSVGAATNTLVQGLTFKKASGTNILAQYPGELLIRNCAFLASSHVREKLSGHTCCQSQKHDLDSFSNTIISFVAPALPTEQCKCCFDLYRCTNRFVQ